MNRSPVALVTGSGKRRVGRTVVDALVERGYAVALHYHTSSSDAAQAREGILAKGGQSIALRADLTDEQQARALVSQVVDHFGRLDLQVNCAAIWSPKTLEQVTAADVRTYFEANLLSVFLCSQHAGLIMVKQDWGGNIINLGDWAEVRPYLNYSAYFATKGAIPALTRCFAVELGTRNPRVRVNCILPGPVMLPPDLPEEERQQSIAGTLVKREGSPKNIAQAVLYLVENDFVTGTSLVVDGGRTIFAQED